MPSRPVNQDTREGTTDDLMSRPSLSIQVPSPPHSHDSPPPTSHSESPSATPTTPTASPAQTRSRRPAGTGKGGKRYKIGRNEFKKAKYTAEERKKQREKWQYFLGKVQEETNAILDENSATGINCPDCFKSISRGNFMRHRTRQGCSNLKPEVMLKFWLN